MSNIKCKNTRNVEGIEPTPPSYKSHLQPLHHDTSDFDLFKVRTMAQLTIESTFSILSLYFLVTLVVRSLCTRVYKPSSTMTVSSRRLTETYHLRCRAKTHALTNSSISNKLALRKFYESLVFHNQGHIVHASF